MGESASNRAQQQSHSLPLIGPRTQAVVGACVLVMTGYTLGLDWLASRLVGVPAGIWIVALVMLVSEYRRQRGDGADEREISRAAAGLLARLDPTRLRLPRINLDRLRAALPGSNAVGGVLELVGVSAGTLDNAKRTITDITNKVSPPNSILRIGVDLAVIDARELIAFGMREDNLGVQVEWVKAQSGLVTDVEKDTASGNFDVLVRRESRGDINIFVAEQDGRAAAWHDWGLPLPLGYAGVFPPRIDPARVALSGCDLQNQDHAALAAQMTVACAMLARAPGRASPAARSSLGLTLTARPAIPAIASPGGPLSAIMQRLGATMRRCVEGDGSVCSMTPGFVKAAARAYTAHLVGFEHGSAAGACAESISFASTLLPGEHEPVLRLAAAQLATGNQFAEDARRTLMSACESLMRSECRCDADPLAFIMSEVELGEPGQMTLGRIAAGIALVWATAPRDTVDYLREDLLDDLAHAGWLRERPGDVQVLKGVLKELEGVRGGRLQAAA